MAVLTHSDTISVTLPAGFTTFSGLAVANSKLWVFAHDDNRLYILPYPLTGGDTPDSQIALPFYLGEDDTVTLDTVGDGFTTVLNISINLLDSAGDDTAFEVDSSLDQMLAVTYDADNSRFIVLARATVGGDGHFLRFTTYDSELDRGAVVDIGGQSGLRLDRGMIEYSSDRVWAMYGRSGRSLDTYSAELVSLGEAQPLAEIPTTDSIEVIDISFDTPNLYVLSSEGNIYVYAGAAVVTEVSVPVQQLHIQTRFFQRYAVVRETTPITVLTFNVDMVASTSVELFRFLIGGSVTLTDVLEKVAIVPQWTIPNIATGDKVFLYSEDSEPTTIPDDALTVEGVQRVGNTEKQVIFVQ